MKLLALVNLIKGYFFILILLTGLLSFVVGAILAYNHQWQASSSLFSDSSFSFLIAILLLFEKQ